ncbi:Transcription initiation factor TFIID TATA-box binding protein [Monocercomonoides exilis]|uniref:Transcription initiation factor TFIID TATA-box binding protein n=1 Tax=Monocercomonoides exilis TaxID=2049356 RepID=UPI0035594BCD|nr:Transcription initiation factor TFIID TATA-box binding protein [Monocercomonoides exilis]|eukprot:MONOS_15940.1-p1 / transcript=MONOS_15940.1 / gene=MONOS_15940 / organism=Monocercomonoides_exilis_PA203 / gene_product=Transcription initiation factor TFIID TATA-box binding protein / transcript_product=Transcription initiation factor TFIID TATA-box binding protein / location=Mono_scaffold01418:2552-3505(-) / protein_length=224 / sequence_SO=supercontig / SO=protein_coding / is_pseudo=false
MSLENELGATPGSSDLDLSLHPSGIVPKLQNVVATAFLGIRLNLRTIASRIANVAYNPRRFPAAVLRSKEPKATVLIFESGKIVCTGARDEDIARAASRKAAKSIQKIGDALGGKISFQRFKIENIVASCDAKFKIQLDRLARNQAQFCRYEPEVFPGVVYRLLEADITFMVFASGKIVITGAKTRDSMYKGFEDIYPILLQFAKVQSDGEGKEKEKRGSRTG